MNVARSVTPRLREVAAWCLFDFANSSYTTLITTVAFSVYFRQAVVGAGNPDGDLLWALAGVLVNGILVATSPIFGALADYSGRKKRFLALTVGQCVVATGLLAFVGPGDVLPALVLYVAATIGFEGGYVFYNAFLPEVSTPQTVGKISGLAWGVGFLGGLTTLAVSAPFIGRPLLDGTGLLDPSAVAGYRISFVLVAVFFAVFSLPTLLLLRDRPLASRPPRWIDYPAIGFRRVADTLTHLRRYREAAKYVLAYVCFFGGVSTVIRFSALYASHTFGIEGKDLVTLFLFTNIVAVPGTMFAGWLADRIGAKRTILLTLLLWVAVALAGALARTRLAFWAMAAGAAIGMGSTQAVGRSFMTQLTPPERESEFFGFYVLAGQLGSILAFLTFGLVSSLSGEQRLAVLWTVPFFGLGLLLTAWVDERRARQEAGS
jgi:UMF1 family MFS transporter